ncbi:septum formation initiator family protein [bacterium]|nr:septum formation initiator family protein [bacterium]
MYKNHKNNRIADLNSAREKFRKKNNKNNSKNNFYYSFLTIILFLCLIQLSFSALLNITKIISYHNKIIQITKIRNDAEKKNNKLKQEIKDFSTTTSLEAIARNNLKMAGEDEVLILINDKDTNNIVEKEKNDKIRIKNIKGIFNNGRQ